jgi:hypothetical protein
MSKYECDIEGCLSGEVTRLGQRLSGEVKRIGCGLTGYISIICTTNKDVYLNVSKNVLWLTPDMLGEEFNIYSNVNWKIE